MPALIVVIRRQDGCILRDAEIFCIKPETLLDYWIL